MKQIKKRFMRFSVCERLNIKGLFLGYAFKFDKFIYHSKLKNHIRIIWDLFFGGEYGGVFDLLNK